MKLYYPDSRVTVRQNFFLCSCCPTMEQIAKKSGISQQRQCFYIASKFNTFVVFNVLFQCNVLLHLRIF